MSDDSIRLHVEACCFGFFFTSVFLEHNISQIYLDLRPKYKSSILKCHFKYISEKYIKPISEKYIKSRLQVYFPTFSLN